jgi:hypothetical protein
MDMKSFIFWDITPCSPLKVNGKPCLPPVFMLGSCSAYSSTLNMEEESYSETSVDFQRTTGRYIQKDRTLQMFRCWPFPPLAFRKPSSRQSSCMWGRISLFSVDFSCSESDMFVPFFHILLILFYVYLTKLSMSQTI